MCLLEHQQYREKEEDEGHTVRSRESKNPTVTTGAWKDGARLSVSH